VDPSRPLSIQTCLLLIKQAIDIAGDFCELLRLFLDLSQSAVVLKMVSSLFTLPRASITNANRKALVAMADPKMKKLLDRAKELREMCSRLIEQSQKVKEQSVRLIEQMKDLSK
jgi:hypothetical protein